MKFFKKVSVLAVAVLVALSSYAAAAASLTGLRSSSTAARDRIVFDLSEMPLYQARPSDDGRSLTLDFADVDTALFKRIAVRTSRIEAISYERHHGHFYVTVALAKGMDYSIGNLTNPFRIFVDVAPKGALTAQRHASVPRPSILPADTDTPPAKAQLPRMEEKQLAAGLTQREYVYEDEDGQVTAYFIEADPARYRVRPALARGVIPGRQTVSGIAQDTNAAAAINASYFALSGELVGITKIDGTVVSSTYFDRSAFGVMPDNSFVFGTVSYNGTVKLDRTSLPVSGVNAERGEDNLIIYNRAYGRSTGTNPYGLEYVIRNGRVAEINTNDSLIPSDGYVVSVHGTIPRLPQILRQHGGITHAHACRCKCIHRRAMHRDDITIGRDQRIIRIDLCHAPIANDILKAIRIRPRRSTIGAVVDDEVVLAALGVDP